MEKREKLAVILQRLKNGEKLACNGVCITAFNNGSQLFWHHFIGNSEPANVRRLKFILDKVATSRDYEVETAEEYEKRTGKKLRDSLYSEEDLREACDLIRSRATEILNILGRYRANLLLYLLDPRGVAVGASLDYNIDTWENFLYRKTFSRIDRIKYDGNEGFTLLAVADMIRNGEI